MTLPTVQRALLVTKIGAPLTLTETYPVPQHGDKQLLLKVKIGGLNPHDRKAQETGLFIADQLPAILGNDVVGVVEAVGPQVTNFRVGDRVVTQGLIGSGYTQAGLQEYSVAEEAFSSKIPSNITDDEAATLPINLLTGVIAIFDVLRIPAPWSAEAKSFDYAGTTLLIVGGGSSCGKFGVQLAKLANIGRIITIGGPEQELKEYGATTVLSRHGGDESVLESVEEVVGDDLIYVYDCVSDTEGQVLTLNTLSSHTRGAMARLLPGRPVDESNVVGKKAGYDIRNVFGNSHVHPALTGPFWEALPSYLETKTIVPLKYSIVNGLDAHAVNKALDAFASNGGTKTHVHV